jgi:GGDEF domain-containing protein
VGHGLRAVMPDGVTVSIGVAAWDGEEPPEALLARADAALYIAKGKRPRPLRHRQDDQPLMPSRAAALAASPLVCTPS